jgi:hypothetical protein
MKDFSDFSGEDWAHFVIFIGIVIAVIFGGIVYLRGKIIRRIREKSVHIKAKSQSRLYMQIRSINGYATNETEESGLFIDAKVEQDTS